MGHTHTQVIFESWQRGVYRRKLESWLINISSNVAKESILSSFYLISDFSFLAPFHRPQTFFSGRKHFSAGANIFHRPQTFLFRRTGWARTFFQAANISQQARTFFTGREHFHLSARFWCKVFKVRLFSKQSVQGAK